MRQGLESLELLFQTVQRDFKLGSLKKFRPFFMAFSSFKMDSSGLRTKNGKLLKNSLSFFFWVGVFRSYSWFLSNTSFKCCFMQGTLQSMEKSCYSLWYYIQRLFFQDLKLILLKKLLLLIYSSPCLCSVILIS